MLRTVLLAIGCVLAIFGLFRVVAGDPGAWPMMIWGAVLALAVVGERWRYRQRDDADSGEWQATEERFIDPETGQLMQVLYEPATGRRRYVPVNADADRHG